MRNISHPVDNRKNVLYTICEISLIFYRKEVYPEAWCSGKVVEKKLLTAAIAMYAKKGYRSTTANEIAAEAGVSTGIAYRYLSLIMSLILK